MLGYKEPLKARIDGRKLHIEVPALSSDPVPCRYYTFKITGIE
jgi:hypothetical protein